MRPDGVREQWARALKEDALELARKITDELAKEPPPEGEEDRSVVIVWEGASEQLLRAAEDALGHQGWLRVALALDRQDERQVRALVTFPAPEAAP